MSSPVAEPADITMHGPRTRHRGVRVSAADEREWLQPFPICPALAMHQIMHLGIARAFAPYRVARTRQLNSYFLACLSGEGKVLVDGRWLSCHAGMAFLLPPHILNSFYATGVQAWEWCWVCYRQPAQQRPLASSSTPVLAKFDASALRHAVEGLIAEAETPGAAAEVHHWIELIHGYVLRFAQPERSDDVLWRLWDRVASSLSAEWNLDRLATEAHWSTEHLRRRCQRQLGRSPMQQVIYLRMRHAAELLISTDDKIETIARAIGYQNQFVFSSTFKKAVGWAPSDYRQRAPRQAGDSRST
jgi:AraC-like DNA-binding protein